VALCAEVEMLAASVLARDKAFYQGYTNMECDGVPISVLSIAKTVVQLCDTYYDDEFIDSTISQNWRWTSSVPDQVITDKTGNQRTVRGYDPYVFSYNELRVPLGEAGMMLLVKGLRLYLFETVRRLFPRNLEKDEWSSDHASYLAPNGSKRCTSNFCTFVDKLLGLYDSLSYLSPDLQEVRAVISRANLAGKEEKNKRREEKNQQREDFRRKKDLERNLRVQKELQNKKQEQIDKNTKKPLRIVSLVTGKVFDGTEKYPESKPVGPTVSAWKKPLFATTAVVKTTPVVVVDEKSTKKEASTVVVDEKQVVQTVEVPATTTTITDSVTVTADQSTKRSNRRIKAGPVKDVNTDDQDDNKGWQTVKYGKKESVSGSQMKKNTQSLKVK